MNRRFAVSLTRFSGLLVGLKTREEQGKMWKNRGNQGESPSPWKPTNYRAARLDHRAAVIGRCRAGKEAIGGGG